jgi:hypothetical protein
VREITRKIDEQINSVRRELANLLSIGIISSDTNNNRLYYEVDQAYEYFKPLKTMFGGGATEDPSAPATAATNDSVKQLKALGNVELALYSGQFTRDETSGVDLLVIGDVNPTKLSKFVEELEKREGKEIRYAVMTIDEFRYRLRVKDRFISLVLESKNQILIDKNNLLTPKEITETPEEE